MLLDDGGFAPIHQLGLQASCFVGLAGLSRSRICKLMKSDDIEFVKVGGSTLILVESLRSFIQGRRRT